MLKLTRMIFITRINEISQFILFKPKPCEMSQLIVIHAPHTKLSIQSPQRSTRLTCMELEIPALTYLS